MAFLFSVIIVLVIQWPRVTEGSLVEERLIADLFRNYTSDSRPNTDVNETVMVTFGLSMNQIVDLQEKKQIMIISAFTRTVWMNTILTWDPKKYDGIEAINVHPSMVWRPDIVLYNNADEDKTYGGSLDQLKTRVIIRYDGRSNWLAPMILKSKCDIDVKYFPFDTQRCPLKFGSWTFDMSRLNLTSDSPYASTEKFSTNSAWTLKSTNAVRHEVTYKCCPEIFPDVTFTIEIARRSLFYVCNLIFPMVLIVMLEILSFLLPAESGERISLAISLLLAMTVFCLVVADIIPVTSEVVPLVGVYFVASMAEMVIMILSLCYVMRLYHIGPTDPPMSDWTRRVILDWLSYIVRVRNREVVITDRKTSILDVRHSLQIHNEEDTLLEKFKLNSNQSQRVRNRISVANYNAGEENKAMHTTRFENEHVTSKLDSLIQHIRSLDEMDEVRTEWRIVATTVDRCFLIVFTMMFLFTTFGCFAYSPGYVS